MEFPSYRKLPFEIRRKIIREAVATRINDAHPRKAGLAHWAASIDSDWNQVIESVVFESIRTHSNELQDFERICASRQDFIRKLTFEFVPTSASPRANQQMVEDAVSKLFHALKDWTPAEKPSHLLKVSMGIMIESIRCRQFVMMPPISCSFTNLPEVPAIGRIYIKPSVHLTLCHQSVQALYSKLPNLHSIQFGLLNTGNLRQDIVTSRVQIGSCHAGNPSLTKLRFRQDKMLHFVNPRQRQSRQDQVLLATKVYPQLSLWHNTLVSLSIHCHIDPPQFLWMASRSAWPNLAKLDLIGLLDAGDIISTRQGAPVARADIHLLRGLIACLPKMPELTTLNMLFSQVSNRRLRMQIGARTDTEKFICKPYQFKRPNGNQRPLTPCSPLAADGAMLKTHQIDLPGALVTEIQDAVRQARGLDLAVFRCSDDLVWIDYPPACTKWNRNSTSWEPVFFNEMDVLIYRMGE
ncbi:hypothetical protein KVR01_009447 [Diaporthe batatas]|uniref:uncharacterized protein n=1 Tax=Diaporthe batatas TaxID=748121 RepID=UPI001D055555|nr:uncharacterized protein KVR01_009447 [Diaporthe batatas]KAG8161183.1 hypothetical protein KVR01_009447 [Diaporthe batatas]